MDLHIKDRLLIPSIFPQTGSFMEFNLKKSILKKIFISEQDKKEYEIVEDSKEQRVTWNSQKDFEVPLAVEFTKEELEYMRKVCEGISEQNMSDDIWMVVERIYDESLH